MNIPNQVGDSIAVGEDAELREVLHALYPEVPLTATMHPPDSHPRRLV